MPDLLERHADIAVLLILLLEDLGVPMPIPADVALLYAGFRLRQHPYPLLAIVVMFAAINIGATILYTVARRGGRPLVDRFGRYVHLNAEKLERAEAWLNRRGMTGIIIGRTLPGIRIVTIIACGLFNVPLRKFLISQFIGVAIYMGVFLSLGYWIGPEAAERIKLPAISFRLVLILLAAVIGPLILRRLNRKTASDDTRRIEARLRPRDRVMADLLAGFGGAIELASIWAIIASVTNIMQRAEIERAVFMLARIVHPDAQSRAVAYTVDYLATLALCLVAAVVFFQWLMPKLNIGPRQLGRQVRVLWGCMLLVIVSVVALSVTNHFVRRPQAVTLWLSGSGAVVFAGLAVGLLGYAYVACQVRRLAIDRLADDPIIAPSVSQDLHTLSVAHEEDEPKAVRPSVGKQPG